MLREAKQNQSNRYNLIIVDLVCKTCIVLYLNQQKQINSKAVCVYNIIVKFLSLNKRIEMTNTSQLPIVDPARELSLTL